jgi:GDP-L-fucose synthase
MASKSVWVTGHNGLVGRALLRRLKHENCDILTSDLDLRDQAKTYQWINDNKPDLVFMTAAKVGGIHANNAYPVEFIHDNLSIQNNIIHGCHLADVNNIIFLGSSCIYPKHCAQPMCENDLMSGALEPTNLYGPCS